MKWYQKTPAIILLLIFFFPVGIFLMWKYTNWKQWVKIVITILLILAAISAFSQQKAASQPAAAPVTSSSTPSSSSSAPAVSSSSSEPSSSTQDPEILKSVALTIDTQIYENVLASEKIEKLLEEGIQATGSGTASLLDLYDLAKTAKETQFSVWSNLSQLSDDNTKDYVSACQLYVINNQGIAEQLMKYIDKNEMKYLSDAKESMELSTSYIISLLDARMKYLTSQGVSEDEILKILDAASKPASE